ncbi:MAG: Ig-like domain-containing protein [Treponema sp.]|jgi:hypothetical protein|nr:Ig-like domain-containing protein [Treponema sp.]
MKGGRSFRIAIAALLSFLWSCGNVMVPDAALRLQDTARTAEEPTAGGGDTGSGPDGTVHVTGVSLDYTTIALTLTSPTQQLVPAISPPNATNQTVIWFSSNPEKAKVNAATGVVTAVSAGTALITALSEDGGKTSSCLVTVSASGFANVGNFTAVPGNTEIALSWDIASLPPDFEYVAISAAPTPPSGSSLETAQAVYEPNNVFTATQLINGTAYTIKIRAYYSGGESSGETSITVTPAVAVLETDMALLIAAPVTGQTANSATTTTGHNEFTRVERIWKKTADNSTHTGPFQAGTAYTAVLTITAKPAYTFSGVGAFTHGALSLSPPLFGADFKTAVVTITFPATAGVTVSGTITSGDSPGGLENASVQLKNGAADYLGPATTLSDGTYAISGVAAGTYTIEVSKAGYASAVITSFTINTANVPNKSASLTLQVTERDLSAILSAPVPASAPDTTLDVSWADNQYTAGSLSWQAVPSGTVTTFEPNKQYKVSFTLTAASGWSFSGLSSADFSYSGAESVSVTIPSNGGSAAVVITFPTVLWTEVDVNTKPGAGTTLASRLQWIRDNGDEGSNYTITLTADETITTQAFNIGIDTNLINVGITIKGDSSVRTVTLSGTGSLFTLIGVGPTQKITLTLGENISLRGSLTNNAPLVSANTSAVLVMESGSKISGNTNTSSSGGGVYVGGTGSSFTMNGGEISGNSSSSSYGGGVYVGCTGTFTLNGGEISDNSSSAYSSGGGGVYVYGTFTMNDGEISGNTTSASSSVGGGVSVQGTITMNVGESSGKTASTSSSSYGGGVYVQGTFTMNDGEISGNSSSSSSSSSYGGGVYVGGTFTMNDGEISGNSSSAYTSSSGGGVYVSGSYNNSTMGGGKISGNTASNAGGSARGGGVYFTTSYSDRFTMNNGEISGNKADSGGGVWATNFTKNGTGGVIFGDNDTTPGGTANTALSGSGHAVMVDKSPTPWTRNSDAGAGVTMNSDIAGTSGGWGL